MAGANAACTKVSRKSIYRRRRKLVRKNLMQVTHSYTEDNYNI